MKSIRVSLIVYFLSLLLLGLSGVSVLAYRTTAENLRDKEHNGRLFWTRGCAMTPSWSIKPW